MAKQTECDEYLKYIGIVAANNCELAATDGVVHDLTKDLLRELATYKEKADAHCLKVPYAMIEIAGEVSKEMPMPYEMLIFWKKYALDLLTWARVADNVALIATSSADAERVFPSTMDALATTRSQARKTRVMLR